MSYIKCPSCGRRVYKYAVNCGFCGHSLTSGSGRSNNRSNYNFNSNSDMIECPSCGRRVKKSAISCGFCGHRLTSSSSRSNHAHDYNSKECPRCGRLVNEYALSCDFCGYNFSRESRVRPNNSNSDMKRCPNCGVMLRKNKKICPRCNYEFKKSNVNKSKKDNSIIKKPKGIKHFNNDTVSFDYPDNYVRDYNSKYNELDIIASFKIGSNYNLNSAFAIFEGESVSDDISDSKFREIIKKSLDADVLDINRYSFGDKERIIIKTRSKSNGNIRYYCTVPEIGFSVLFIIPIRKESYFDENYISIVVNSLEKSTSKSGNSYSSNEVYSDSADESSEDYYSNEVYLDSADESSDEDSLEKSLKSSINKEIKVCTNCGSENPIDSNFCMECGMKLDISKDVNFCIHCGTEIVHGAKFCMNCGKLIEY